MQPLAADFVAAVASARGLTPEAVIALDAAVFLAPAAIEAGLVDALGSLEDAIALVASRAASKSTASAPQLPAAPPAAAKGSPMKVSASLLALVPGLAADATDPAVEAAVLPLLSLAKATLEATGEKDPARALGVLEARTLAAAELSTLKAKLAADDAAAAQAKVLADAEAEKVERHGLVHGLVQAGALLPVKAWAKTAEGIADPKLGPAPKWASMPIEGLRAMAEDLQPIKLSGSSSPDVTQALADASALGLPPEAKLAATKAKDPAKFTALHNWIASGAQPTAAEG